MDTQILNDEAIERERKSLVTGRKHYLSTIDKLSTMLGKRVRVEKLTSRSGLYPYQIVATGKLVKLEQSFIVIERDDLHDHTVPGVNHKQIVTFVYSDFVTNTYSIEEI